MTRKPWIRISAVVTVLALCLSLPRLFPVFSQAFASGESYGFTESVAALGDSQMSTADDDRFPPDNQLPDEGDKPDPQQPGADVDDITLVPDDIGDDTASEEFDEGGSPPAGTDEDDENPEGLGDEEKGPPEEEPEAPLTLGASGLTKSSRSVPGYNVFEVDSFAALAKALSTTSYPSEEYPETSVYILLTGNVDIQQGFTLHSSIEKVTIDGAGQHTLSEINTQITRVSNKTVEVKFMDLTIIGYQYYGLFQNAHNTDVSYHYERVGYTGPQILHAFNSTAHFTGCNIHITGAGAGTVANEVAEIRDVIIYGNNQFRHNSPHSVFWLLNNGNLVLSDGAEMNINATGANNYILFTSNEQSTLCLEDRASLSIEGTSSQLAGNAGLHSIYLGENATFHWKAHRTDTDYIVVNNSGGGKDAIYLSEGAAFRVEPNGTPGGRLIWIKSGNVVVGPGASFSMRAALYNGSQAPLHLEVGSLTVGESATFTMQIRNRNELSSGLIYFGVGGNGFFVDRDATVVMRGERTSAALHFSGSNSSVEITDPNYLEIVVTQGFPILFFNATALAPNTLTYTDVQQINYWPSGSNTYLNGGGYLQRWVAQTEGFTVKARYSGNRNGSVSMESSGTLDQQWTPVFDDKNFDMNMARILSVGKIGMEVSSEGNAYQGRIMAPMMGVPYDQGAVQLRVGQPGAYRAVSPLMPATPDFQVAPNQAVGADDKIAVWAEFGYVFHNNLHSVTEGALSLTVPDRIEFGVLTVAFSDTQVPAAELYTLQVQDQRRAGWQVMASFSGFSSAEKSLDSTLLVNDIPLQETHQRIAASAGTYAVPLDASLLVPGGAAEAGTYSGNITWTLVNAP